MVIHIFLELLTLTFVTISEQEVSSTYFHMSAGVSKSWQEITKGLILFPGGRQMAQSAIQTDNLGHLRKSSLPRDEQSSLSPPYLCQSSLILRFLSDELLRNPLDNGLLSQRS